MESKAWNLESRQVDRGGLRKEVLRNHTFFRRQGFASGFFTLIGFEASISLLFAVATRCHPTQFRV